MTPLRIRSVHVYRLEIPMRVRFEHAAGARRHADPVIVQVTAAAPYAHEAGYGETLARVYVTGETPESVVEDITNLFAPRLTGFAPTSFPEALEFIEALPTQLGGRIVTAARCAVELALLDLAGHVFRRRPADIAGWLGLGGFGPPGCRAAARYSGIVLGNTPRRLTTFLKVQRCYGLRDFKLKVAVPGWEERLEWAWRVLRRSLAAQQVTLRVDANAGWTYSEALAALPWLESHGVGAIEQPLSEAEDDQLPTLAEHTRCDLIVDESLLTASDAQRLIAGGGVRVFNIRLAKNGGLMPALRLAHLALTAGLDVQLGCLVGETSLLSAAGVAFLDACPQVRFVEGAYGPWLLREDIARKPIRFKRRGRIDPPKGYGLGVVVDPHRLERLAVDKAKSLQL